MTAAHKTHAFGSKLKVTNKKNGKSVTVTVIDRGPFVKGRCIDLTQAAAATLGFSGLAPVIVTKVQQGEDDAILHRQSGLPAGGAARVSLRFRDSASSMLSAQHPVLQQPAGAAAL